MPTTITTPSNTLAKVRFQEQFVSEALNRKFNGVVPRGVVRGGLLVTAGAGLNVRVDADPTEGDSIYSYVDGNGHQLTFRQVGNVTLDLTSVVSTSVYIALFIQYTTSTATVVEWRAYTIAELTTAPVAEAGEVVVVGRVDVPAAGPIVASEVLPELRREAAFFHASATREWKQIVINGDFEIAGTNSGSALVGTWVAGWESFAGGTNYDHFVSTTAPLIGTHEIEFRADGVGAISDSLAGSQEGFYKCRAGQLVRGQITMRGATWTAVGASGFVGLQLLFYDSDFQVIGTGEEIGIDSTFSGTFAYTTIERIVEAPTAAVWVRVNLKIDTDSVVPGAGESIFVDNVKVWVQRPVLDEDSRDEDHGTLSGPIIGNSLTLSPPPTTPNNPDDMQRLSLKLANIGSSSGIGAGEFLELLFEFLRGDIATNAHVYYLKQIFDGAIQHFHIQDSETAREVAWNELYSFDASGTKDMQTRYAFGDGSVETDVGSLRLYTSNQIQASALPSGFEITFNAFWDVSAALWNRDQAIVNSWLLTITEDYISLFYKDVAGGATWADGAWDQAAGFPALKIATHDGGGTSQAMIEVNGSPVNDAAITVRSAIEDYTPALGSFPAITLRQQTVVKSWGHIEINASGTIIASDGYNFTAVRVGNVFNISFVDALANAQYAVVGSVSDEAGAINRAEMVSFANLAVGGFTLVQHDDTGTAVTLTANAGIYSFIVFGED